MKTLVGAAGVFAVSSLPWGVLAAKELNELGDKKYPKQKITDVKSIPVGDAVDFHFPGEHDSAILIRLDEEKYVAYQNACTHLRCPVFWKKKRKKCFAHVITENLMSRRVHLRQVRQDAHSLRFM